MLGAHGFSVSYWPLESSAPTSRQTQGLWGGKDHPGGEREREGEKGSVYVLCVEGVTQGPARTLLPA